MVCTVIKRKLWKLFNNDDYIGVEWTGTIVALTLEVPCICLFNGASTKQPHFIRSSITSFFLEGPQGVRWSGTSTVTLLKWLGRGGGLWDFGVEKLKNSMAITKRIHFRFIRFALRPLFFANFSSVLWGHFLVYTLCVHSLCIITFWGHYTCVYCIPYTKKKLHETYVLRSEFEIDFCKIFHR